MCLGIPARLVKVDGDRGLVDIDGIQREIGLDLVEDVKPGDWVLVHVGYAISVIDREEAEKTLELLKELSL